MAMTRKRKAVDDGKTVDKDDNGSLTLDEVKGKLDGDSCYIVASYMEHKWDDDCTITWDHPTNDMLTFLRRIGYVCDQAQYYLIVLNVAHECNLDRLKLALASSPVDEYAVNLFDSVCSDGHLPSVQYMVERYTITKQHVEMNGSRALWWAASQGRLDVVRYLVTHFTLGRDRYNQSLFYASQNGHLDVVKYLVVTFGCTVDDVSTTLSVFGGSNAFNAACTSVTHEVARTQIHLSGGPHNQDPSWKRADQFGVLQYFTRTFTILQQRVSDGTWALMCRDELIDRIRHL